MATWCCAVIQSFLKIRAVKAVISVVNKFTSAVFTFIVPNGRKWYKSREHYGLWISWKIRTGKAILFLREYLILHLRVYCKTAGHTESKERLDSVCTESWSAPLAILLCSSCSVKYVYKVYYLQIC